MKWDRRPSTRLSVSARRLFSLAVLCTASVWWLAAAVARADTPPTNDGAQPTISGVAQQGDVLTADPGGWSGDAPITFTYAWSDGQAGNSITLSAGDVGQSLTVTVTATNNFGQASSTSASVGPVLPAAPTPGNPAPAISGTAQQGQTLSVSNGTWSGNPTAFAYVWEDCDGSGGNCTAITGATSSTYTLQPSDVGSTIVASVTASNAGGPGSATSAAVGPVLPTAPVPGNPPPAITGAAQQGNTLSVSNGTWSGNPTSFTYLWEDCDGAGANCVAITGATSSSYTLQPSDVGSTILAAVTARNAGGPGSATSATVGPVLPAAPTIGANKPAIAGTPQQGNTLSVSNGTWSGSPTGFAYVWEDCDGAGSNCAAITGATASAYTLQAADVGHKVVAQVTASNAGGQNSATSAAVGSILPAAPTPGSQPPGISGTPQQGHTLSVSNGAWNNTPTSFTYVWEACDSAGVNCAPISGATSSSYTLKAADVGNTIVAQVTAANAGGQNSATSAGVGPVLPLAPTIGANKPSITGTPQQGNTLSAGTGTWDNSPTSFAYVWEDCDSSGNNCTAITGATSSSYTLTASDVPSKLVVQVTASNAGGQNTASSAAVGPVLPFAPAAGTPPPAISGTAQQGHTLTVTNGTWSNTPTGFAYVWEDCDSSGNNCTAIAGATSSSYTLTANDVKDTIVAQVTASNAGGHNTATSARVGPVVPPAPTIGASKPGITGTPQQGNTLSVSNGSWSNNPSFAYVWEDCNSSGANCTPIAGATSNTYTLQASDVGDKVLAQVTASNDGGQNSASSPSVGPVLPAAPALGTAPGITGTAQQGQTLTVSNGTWSNNPTKFTYAWQACDSSGSNCSSIGTNSNTYTLAGTDVHRFVDVTVTASNAGGSTPVITASVGPVLLPPPANSSRPSIAKTGGTLSITSNGTWSNNPTGFSYTWKTCDASGANCTAIPGATSSSYALSAADIGTTILCVVTATGEGGTGSASTTKTAIIGASDIPPASQPTATGLLATPVAPVTNQNVTLIATVTAGTSSTALWGTVKFENGGAAIDGCANMPAVPSGRSATVACSTSFPASTAQLNAVFIPASGSILKGSSSPGTSLAVGPDASATTLTAASSVNVGANTTYTAAVSPGSHPGPVQPTGSVEFLDGGTPIGSCASQPLSGGGASCTVSYPLADTHQITARYSGDPNFIGSSSPASQVTAVTVPTPVLGTITATMQWAFYFTPNYTLVRNLVVNGVAPGAQVVVRCQGHGCPFTTRATVLSNGKRCGRKAKRPCLPPGTLNLTTSFTGRHLAVGARISVSIVSPGWVGKSYRFMIRSRRGPRVQIGSLPVS